MDSDLIIYLILFIIFVFGSLIKKVGESVKGGQPQHKPLPRQDAHKYLSDMRGARKPESSSLYRAPSARPPSRPAPSHRPPYAKQEAHPISRVAPKSDFGNKQFGMSDEMPLVANISEQKPFVAEPKASYLEGFVKPSLSEISEQRPYDLKVEEPIAPFVEKTSDPAKYKQKKVKKEQVAGVITPDAQVHEEKSTIHLPEHLSEIQRAIIFSQILGKPKAIQLMEQSFKI